MEERTKLSASLAEKRKLIPPKLKAIHNSRSLFSLNMTSFLSVFFIQLLFSMQNSALCNKFQKKCNKKNRPTSQTSVWAVSGLYRPHFGWLPSSRRPSFQESLWWIFRFQDGISNGFLQVRKSWLDVEIQAMANCHCERFFVHEKTDGHIHVNLIFLLVFHSFSLKLRQSGIEEIRNILVFRNKSFDFIQYFIDAVTNVREVCTVWSYCVWRKFWFHVSMSRLVIVGYRKE